MSVACQARHSLRMMELLASHSADVIAQEAGVKLRGGAGGLSKRHSMLKRNASALSRMSAAAQPSGVLPRQLQYNANKLRVNSKGSKLNHIGKVDSLSQADTWPASGYLHADNIAVNVDVGLSTSEG